VSLCLLRAEAARNGSPPGLPRGGSARQAQAAAKPLQSAEPAHVMTKDADMAAALKESIAAAMKRK